MDWFLYHNGLRHERVKENYIPMINNIYYNNSAVLNTETVLPLQDKFREELSLKLNLTHFWPMFLHNVP